MMNPFQFYVEDFNAPQFFAARRDSRSALHALSKRQKHNDSDDNCQ
jgi:hypothetical protein